MLHLFPQVYKSKSKLNALDRSQAMLELQVDGTISYANENLLSMLGYRFDEVEGKPYNMLVDAAFAKTQEGKDAAENINLNKCCTTVLKCATKNGSELWIQASINPVTNGKGKISSMILLIQDWTQHHNITNEIEDLRVRASITDMTSIVSESDLKGDILTINEKFIEISKYGRDELIGKPHNTTRHPDMPKDVFKEVWSTIGRGNTFRGIIKNRAKDGTPYYVDAVIAPVMGANGKPRKYIGVRYDITAAEIERQNMKGILSAIDNSYSYAEYDTNGNVITANENFLKLFGYRLEGIVGKHQSMFVDANHAKSDAHHQLWKDLSAGNSCSDVYRRTTKDNHEIWIQAVYAPVKDEMGRVYKMVEIGTDVTAEKVQSADYAGQIAAIGKSQAVIEFNMDGTIIGANENFLGALGYNLDEIKGKHHSMFVDNAYKASADYKQFWDSLNRGEYQQAEYKRFGKGGREIWIQASYNPIMDLNGKPFKIVKYATDITQMVLTRTENEAGMNEAVKVLTGVSQGDLTQKMELDYTGTFGQIKTAVNSTVDKLYDMVNRIIDAAQSVNSAASEIASGSTDLSQRTEEQASSLEETAASMEQITGTVRQNSENARTANGLSAQANQVATDGGKVVEEAVTAMASIEKSSQKISDIIGVIDEIAFQTNLLALNAAVEAARAGDAGKGFAVVAAEVRSLAGRSASASKEIKALINESASQVQTGAELVNKAGATLKDIVGSVQKVAGIVSEIASASQEQATGIDEINTAVTQMDETTQQNAALVEENTAAAQSMVEQAQSLEQLMGFFTINANEEEKAPSRMAAESGKPSDRRAPASPMRKSIEIKTAKKPIATYKPAIAAKVSNGHAAEDGWKEF